MQAQLAIKEQVVKKVVKSGNGGAVWVPKNWLGQEVVVILPQKPKLELKEKIVHLLEPYLKDIVAVGIYGSFARNEQTKDSDVDVLVITKDKKLVLNFKDEKIEVISFTIDNLKKAIKKYPTTYYFTAREAVPLVNASVLEELKEVKVEKQDFVNYLEETKDHLKSNMELLELDKLDGNYLSSYSVVYSLILRLRGIFIISCILKNKPFSNKEFKKWATNRGISNEEFEDSHKVYRLIRDEQSIKNLKIKIEVVEKLLNSLEKELKSLETKIHGK
ncbi:MAG: nucleotidyltransferase domain-containing protein [Candidatus Woesearchaeota archaeon]